jgi:hypothetical protein
VHVLDRVKKQNAGRFQGGPDSAGVGRRNLFLLLGAPGPQREVL